MVRLTKRAENGNYKVEPLKMFEAVNKLGRFEDWIEEILNSAVEVEYEDVEREVVSCEV